MKYDKFNKLERKITYYNFIRDLRDGDKFAYCLFFRIIAIIISKYYTWKWENYYN